MHLTYKYNQCGKAEGIGTYDGGQRAEKRMRNEGNWGDNKKKLSGK